MKIKYFRDIDVLNIDIQEGAFKYSEEPAEGIIFDISEDGEILSIEVLDAEKRFEEPVAERIIKKYMVTA